MINQQDWHRSSHPQREFHQQFSMKCLNNAILFLHQDSSYWLCLKTKTLNCFRKLQQIKREIESHFGQEILYFTSKYINIHILTLFFLLSLY